MRWGQDPTKWLIVKQLGEWRVYTPVLSFWGQGGDFPSFEEARQHLLGQADFV